MEKVVQIINQMGKTSNGFSVCELRMQSIPPLEDSVHRILSRSGVVIQEKYQYLMETQSHTKHSKSCLLTTVSRRYSYSTHTGLIITA